MGGLRGGVCATANANDRSRPGSSSPCSLPHGAGVGVWLRWVHGNDQAGIPFDNVDSELVTQPLQSNPKDIGRFMLTTLVKRMYIRRHGWQ